MEKKGPPNQQADRSLRYWLGGKRSREQDQFFEEALPASRWQKGDAEDWNACWYTGMPKANVFRWADPEHKINHIPGNNALTVKSRLHDSIAGLRERIQLQEGEHSRLLDRLKFLPHVFSMPEDYHAFQQTAWENPARRWILKPKNAARGKGIRLIKDPAEVPLESSWMVQEYLENPHTMHGRKYVLRLYVLISSITPLRVYLYRQGFAKLASAPYDAEDLDNPYSYLTNPDINALNLEAEVPVEFVDLERYRGWLCHQGHDDETLFRRIEDMITLTCISAVEAMRKRTAASGADPRGCYELLGIDCLVDADLNPWILECNLSPSLGVCAGPESGGDVEESVKRQLVRNMVELVGLNTAATAQVASEEANRLVEETEAEYARAGGFRRLYPCADVEHYLPYFPMPRLADWVLAEAVSGRELQPPTLRRNHANDVVTDDKVFIYESHTGRLNELNETASLIWLMAVDGATPKHIAETLRAAVRGEYSTGVDDWKISEDVWNALADWTEAGLLIQDTEPREAQAATETPTVVSLHSSSPPHRFLLDCGATGFEIRTDSQPLTSRLEPLLRPMIAGRKLPVSSELEIVRDTAGYTLILDGTVVHSRLKLAQVCPAAIECVARHAAVSCDILVYSALLSSPDARHGSLLVGGGGTELGDALALYLAQHQGWRFGAVTRLAPTERQPASALALPGRLPTALLEHFEIAPTRQRHQFRDGTEGLLVSASSARSNIAQRVEAICIPSVELLAEPGETRALSVAETLRYLVPHCFMRDGRPLDKTRFAQLVAWLEQTPRFLVDARDLAQAEASLTTLILAPGPITQTT